MSCIEKMTIQGVRSFGPADENMQKIEFFRPLTIIVGPNGCGKTTIIECLKFATCGSLPPGAKTGAAFVHDPKLAGYPTVKGAVQLQLRDVNGKQLLVKRLMQASLPTRGNGAASFKTLDGVMKRVGSDGNPQSITCKCADLDRDVTASLGVSRAVIENVLFCHQEESNWPLSEAKAVKETFDALFESERYVRALSAVKEQRKSCKERAELAKTELSYLDQQVERAEDIEHSVVRDRRKLEDTQAQLGTIDAELRAVEARMLALSLKHKQVEELRQTRDKSAPTLYSVCIDALPYVH